METLTYLSVLEEEEEIHFIENEPNEYRNNLTYLFLSPGSIIHGTIDQKRTINITTFSSRAR